MHLDVTITPNWGRRLEIRKVCLLREKKKVGKKYPSNLTV